MTTNIINIIRNDDKIYEGDLIYYFKIVFNKANNLQNPYHNFRHLMHVMYLCHEAIVWNIKKDPKSFSKMSARNLLIAALFHDFDHSGTVGRDADEIARAIKAVRENISKEDKPQLKEIETLIEATQYPHKAHTSQQTIAEEIIQDVDLSTALDDVWMQQVILGLGSEMSLSPQVMLERQIAFLNNIHFHSAWAKAKFTPEKIASRINEVEAMLGFLS